MYVRPSFYLRATLPLFRKINRRYCARAANASSKIRESHPEMSKTFVQHRRFSSISSFILFLFFFLWHFVGFHCKSYNLEIRLLLIKRYAGSI